MFAYLGRSLPVLLIAFALFTPSQASGKGIVLITRGDTINNVGAVSVPGAPANVQVGYKYSYFGIFWIDFWTYDGTYRLYEGKNYMPLEPADAAKLLGKSESDLGRPFLYVLPLGWLIVGPLIVIGVAAAVLRKRKRDALTGLFEDPRYQKAVEVLNEEYAKQPVPAEGTAPEADNRFQVAFEAGVQHLMSVGVPREEAERNLGIVIHVLSQSQQQATPGEAGTT